MEFDALEAQHPGIFERIVRAALETYYDTDLKCQTGKHVWETRRNVRIL